MKTASNHQSRLNAQRPARFAVIARASLLLWFSALVLCAAPFDRALANSGPQFGAIADQFISEGQMMTLELSASDGDGDAISLGMNARPAGVRFIDHGDGSATCEFDTDYLGERSSLGSPFAFEFFVTDGSATATQSVSLFVQNVNRRPAITAPDTIFVEVGDTVNFSVSAHDPDLDPVSWTSPALPGGARLESASGSAFANFQWTPIVADSGLSTIDFVATDYWGASDTSQTTVIVTVGAPFTLSISIDTAFPGELVPVEVRLKNREAIRGFELVIHSDPSVMSILSVDASNSRAANFGSFLYVFNIPVNGDIRVNGATASGEVLPAGDGPLFVLNALVSTQAGLAGFYLPIDFVFRVGADPNDNTMTDADGEKITISTIVYVNGGTKVKEPKDIAHGDINLNGVPFEVGDALRFSNYFIDPIHYGFNAQQYANSDVNDDGIVASVADLVTLLNIVTGAGGSKTIPSTGERAGEARLSESFQNGQSALLLDSDTPVGALYFEAQISGAGLGQDFIEQDIFELSSEAKSSGMVIEQAISDSKARVLIYSPTGEALEISESSTLVSWNSSNALIEIGAFENLEASSASGQLMEALFSDGAEITEAVLPNDFSLSQNYPNPFNPVTKIPFSLDVESSVTLTVYDLLGRTVNTLVSGSFGAGAHEVRWEGADDNGAPVASGVYFYRLKSGERTLSRKMALLK